jgi:hypothetical protein
MLFRSQKNGLKGVLVSYGCAAVKVCNAKNATIF